MYDGIVVNGIEVEADGFTLHIAGNGQCTLIDGLAGIILQALHDIIGMGHRYIVVLTIYREVPLAAERYVLLGSSMQCKTRNDCKKQSSHMRIVLN